MNKKKDYREVPAGLESRLITLIDNLDKQDSDKRKRARRLTMQIGSIAASLLVLVSIGFLVNKKNRGGSYQARDKELCMEAQKALELVAVNLNKGFNQMELIHQQIEKTNHLLDKSFNN